MPGDNDLEAVVDTMQPLTNESEEGQKPAPILRAKFNELQTDKNTPLQDFQDPVTIKTKELLEEARDEGYITVFLGADKQTINRVDEIIGKWVAARSAQAMVADGDITPSQAQTRINAWDEARAVYFGDKAIDEVEAICRNMFQFASNMRNDILVRNRMVRQPGITNILSRGGELKTPLIVGRKPGANNKEVSISQLMRRTALRTSGDSYNFDINLPNSFIRITIKRPNLLEMGSLIQDLAKEVKGYVRDLNNNSMVLANIAGMKVIWRFVADRIIDCSIKDIEDMERLADNILITDFDALCVGLINSIYTRGVNMDLRCLHEGCNWGDFRLTDPAKLTQLRHHTMTTDELAVLGNIMNSLHRYTKHEVNKLQNKAKYGVEQNRVYNEDETYYFEIRPPAMTQAFQTFDNFISEINPLIQELRANVLDQNEFEDNVAVLLNSVNSLEFMHWVGKYVVVGTPGTDERDQVIERTAANCTEFNLGLRDIMNDDEFIANALVKYIYNHAAQMSKYFVGVGHFECPNCAKNSKDADNREFGYTPINAFMTFFTLTQLKLLNRAADKVSVQEALS